MKAVNLLPADARPSKRSTGRTRAPSPRGPLPVGPLAVLSVLAALVVAVVLLSLAGNRVREHESRLAAVKAQEQIAQAQIARLQAYGTFRQLASDRLSTVRQLAGSRFDWEQTLRDLSRAMPADVTVDNITGTVAPGARAGGTSSANPLRALREVPAIEITGCTRDQDSVARLMARLRGVRGVSRVSLAKSAKEDNLASGTTLGAGAVAVGCGRGSKPKFQLVMFFEAAGATIPAGGTATPAASGTPSPSGTPAPGATTTPAPSGTPAAGATPAPTAGSSTPAPPGQAPVNQGETK